MKSSRSPRSPERCSAAERSTRLPEDTWDYQKTGAKEPPYDLDALCVFLEINPWHYRRVKAKAIPTAGHAFVVPEDVKQPKPENKQAFKDFFNHPNNEMTWGEIVEKVLTDRPLGNGNETARNRSGTTAISHVPAVTMRVRKDKKGFFRQRDNRMISIGSDSKAPDAFEPRDKPSEKRRLLIQLKNYHPRSNSRPAGLRCFGPSTGKGEPLATTPSPGTRSSSRAASRRAGRASGSRSACAATSRATPTRRSSSMSSSKAGRSASKAARGGHQGRLVPHVPRGNAEGIRVAHDAPGGLIGIAERGPRRGRTQQEIFKYHASQRRYGRSAEPFSAWPKFPLLPPREWEGHGLAELTIRSLRGAKVCRDGILAACFGG